MSNMVSCSILPDEEVTSYDVRYHHLKSQSVLPFIIPEILLQWSAILLSIVERDWYNHPSLWLCLTVFCYQKSLDELSDHQKLLCSSQFILKVDEIWGLYFSPCVHVCTESHTTEKTLILAIWHWWLLLRLKITGNFPGFPW